MAYSEVKTNKTITLSGKSLVDNYIGSYFAGLKNDETGSIDGNLTTVGTNITAEFAEPNDWCTISFGTSDGTGMPILCTVTRNAGGQDGASRSCKFKLKYSEKTTSVEFTINQLSDNTSGDITPDPQPDGKFYIKVRGIYNGNVYFAGSDVTGDDETKEYINAFGTPVQHVMNDIYAYNLDGFGGYITVSYIGGLVDLKYVGDHVYVYVWRDWYYDSRGPVTIEYNTSSTPVEC